MRGEYQFAWLEERRIGEEDQRKRGRGKRKEGDARGRERARRGKEEEEEERIRRGGREVPGDGRRLARASGGCR